MKELEPLRMLRGKWSGKGKGSYGPFSAELVVEERGRWLLMCQEIKIPIVHITTYVSTQVYGYDESGLTLDYFDTAGSFKFHGFPDETGLSFTWKKGRSIKTSLYWQEDDDKIGFKYDSVEEQENSEDLKHVTFEGVWTVDS